MFCTLCLQTAGSLADKKAVFIPFLGEAAKKEMQAGRKFSR
jgi:hypothetical protein